MADFTSYEQIVKWLGKGKKRSEGRRKRALMLRMVEDVVVVSHCRRAYPVVDNKIWHLTDFAEIRSSNVLTFTRDTVDMIHIAASLSQVLPRVLGLAWWREGKGRYKVFPVPERGYYYEAVRGPKSFEHFKNMMWDLSDGTCFNPRAPVLKTVDRDSRKEWLADLKRFKRAFLTRAKLGIIDQIIAERGTDADKPDHFDARNVDDTVLDTIKSGEVTTTFIRQIVECRAATGWRPVVSRTSVCNMLNVIINRNSIRYRQAYGVLRK